MRRSIAVIGVLGIALSIAACADEAEPQEGPTPRAISQECRDAFAEAHEAMAERDEDRDADGDFGGGAGLGSLSQLEPSVTACATTDEWYEGYRATWSERTEGVSPTNALRTLCRSGRDQPLRDQGVCQQIVIDAPGSQPGNA